MERVKSDDLLIVQCQDNETVEYIDGLRKALAIMLADRAVVLPKNVSLIAVPRGTQVVYQ